jgi:2-phosphosulfolactate phosphatase
MPLQQARYLANWELGELAGPAAAIDTIRAFTTAAYAFGAGARRIWLVDDVAEALALLAENPTWLAMGEDHGLRPDGFALPNSPVLAWQADLEGRVVVQRTTAGTRGAVAAATADPLLCASLVIASATAAMLRDGPAPTYVITGRSPTDALRAHTGQEDLATARYIEGLRLGSPPGSPTEQQTVQAVLTSPDARFTAGLGGDHVHPDDLAYCVDVDRFDFALRARSGRHGLALDAVRAR